MDKPYLRLEVTSHFCSFTSIRFPPESATTVCCLRVDFSKVVVRLYLHDGHDIQTEVSCLVLSLV